MRKFKNYKQVENISNVHLLSFYNLKRTKWSVIRLRLLWAISKKKFSKKKVINLFKVKREIKFWGKMSNQHRQQNSLLKRISMLHSNSLSKKFYLVKYVRYKQKFIKILIKSLLKLDILLWLCNFFVSSKVARFQIILGNLYLNKKKVLFPVFLKHNDILQFKEPSLKLKPHTKFSNFFYNTNIFKLKKLSIKKNSLNKKSCKFKFKTFFFQFKKKYSLSLSKIKKVLVVKKKKYYLSCFILSFLEIDIYSKSIVVVKDFNNFVEKDICLSAKEYFDIQQF